MDVKPSQRSVATVSHRRPDLRIELDRIMAEIRDDARKEQRQWETQIADSLTAEGVPDDVARYAARHSWTPGTAFEKAIKVQKILNELKRY